MNSQSLPAPIEWQPLLPLICVISTGVLVMMIEMIRPRKANDVIVWFSLIGLATAIVFLVANWTQPTVEFFGYRFQSEGGGLFLHDRFGQIAQLVLIGCTFLTVMLSEGYLRERRLAFGEFYPLVLWTAAGGMIMATTRDLMILFLGLEVLSISLYILAGLSQKERRSQESALKYFLLGAFASSFLLYGIALIYGATGTTHISGIAELFRLSIPNTTSENLCFAGVGLILIGLAFKAAFVPFHMWTPDVYQGAPTVVTGFMAAGSKVAAFVALVRFLEAAMPMRDIWIPILIVIAVITMTLGNLVALAQRDVKRILAYSSIAHAGYLLIAVAAWAKSQDIPGYALGYATILYYLVAYSIMTIGAFAVVSVAARKGKEGTLLEDLNGMFKIAPFPAMMMVVFMASLAGVPPTGGFMAKFFIFKDAIEVNLGWLAIALAINSVISVFYYLKIVIAVSVNPPQTKPNSFAPVNAGLFATCAACGAGILAIFVFLEPMLNWLGL